MKYVYPAVFTPEEKGFSINFPDIDSCYTCGDDLIDGIKMAEDALAFRLYDIETANEEIPKPTTINDLVLNKGEFATLIPCDTIGYQKMNNGKAVKKTLTIPQWMDEMASAKGINFSQLLQEAIVDKLEIEK
jgi:predicted RNase H-like HicB family nuclease